jgi:hypothetical protein
VRIHAEFGSSSELIFSPADLRQALLDKKPPRRPLKGRPISEKK